jgi:hypothetical protein
MVVQAPLPPPSATYTAPETAVSAPFGSCRLEPVRLAWATFAMKFYFLLEFTLGGTPEQNLPM